MFDLLPFTLVMNDNYSQSIVCSLHDTDFHFYSIDVNNLELQNRNEG